LSPSETNTDELFLANLRLFNDVLAASPLAGHCHLAGGMLLGMARSGHPLPGDLDVDVFFFQERLRDLPKTVSLLTAAGFEPKYRLYANDGELAEYSLVKDGAKFEFFSFRRLGGGLLQYFVFTFGRNGEQFDKRYLDIEHAPVRFLDREWLVPVDTDAALAFMYGDWRTPDPEWNWCNDPKIVKREPWRYDWCRCHTSDWSPVALLCNAERWIRRSFRGR